MTPTKINPGRYQKMTRRFVEPRLFGRDRVHAMRYNRGDRTWSVECGENRGDFPGAGFMLGVDEHQPIIDCKRCLHDLADRA